MRSLNCTRPFKGQTKVWERRRKQNEPKPQIAVSASGVRDALILLQTVPSQRSHCSVKLAQNTEYLFPMATTLLLGVRERRKRNQRMKI